MSCLPGGRRRQQSGVYVSRLSMLTSSSQHVVCAGLMVVVKQGDDVHLHLSRQFKDRTVSF